MKGTGGVLSGIDFKWQGALVLTSKANIVGRRSQISRSSPSVPWDPRKGLDLILEDEHVGLDQDGNWVLCLRLSKMLPPTLSNM